MKLFKKKKKEQLDYQADDEMSRLGLKSGWNCNFQMFFE
jgi:hypothetical protein